VSFLIEIFRNNKFASSAYIVILILNVIFYTCFMRLSRKLVDLMKLWTSIHSRDGSFCKIKRKILLIFILLLLRSLVGNFWFRLSSVITSRKCWSKSKPIHQSIMETLFPSFFIKYKYNDYLAAFIALVDFHQTFGLVFQSSFVIAFAFLISWEIEMFNKQLRLRTEQESVDELIARYKKLCNLISEVNNYLRLVLFLVIVNTLYTFCNKCSFYLR